MTYLCFESASSRFSPIWEPDPLRKVKEGQGNNDSPPYQGGDIGEVMIILTLVLGFILGPSQNQPHLYPPLGKGRPGKAWGKFHPGVARLGPALPKGLLGNGTGES